MFQDMAQFQNLELGNPSFVEYKYEDFVGWVSKLAQRWGGPCTYIARLVEPLASEQKGIVCACMCVWVCVSVCVSVCVLCVYVCGNAML